MLKNPQQPVKIRSVCAYQHGRVHGHQGKKQARLRNEHCHLTFQEKKLYSQEKIQKTHHAREKDKGGSLLDFYLLLGKLRILCLLFNVHLIFSKQEYSLDQSKVSTILVFNVDTLQRGLPSHLSKLLQEDSSLPIQHFLTEQTVSHLSKLSQENSSIYVY